MHSLVFFYFWATCMLYFTRISMYVLSRRWCAAVLIFARFRWPTVTLWLINNRNRYSGLFLIAFFSYLYNLAIMQRFFFLNAPNTFFKSSLFMSPIFYVLLMPLYTSLCVMVILSLIKADVSGIDKFFRDRESYSLIPTGVKPSASVTGYSRQGYHKTVTWPNATVLEKEVVSTYSEANYPPFYPFFTLACKRFR